MKLCNVERGANFMNKTGLKNVKGKLSKYMMHNNFEIN